MAVTVLLVEDEALLARNVKTYLERRGYQVEVAGDLAAARKSYRACRPDVAIVDHDLPDGTGLALVDEIRGQDRRTKLAMITGYGGGEIAHAAMRSGANEFLAKPVSLEAIARLVGKLSSAGAGEG